VQNVFNVFRNSDLRLHFIFSPNDNYGLILMKSHAVKLVFASKILRKVCTPTNVPISPIRGLQQGPAEKKNVLFPETNG
jgi:hypothetical protein